MALPTLGLVGGLIIPGMGRNMLVHLSQPPPEMQLWRQAEERHEGAGFCVAQAHQRLHQRLRACGHSLLPGWGESGLEFPWRTQHLLPRYGEMQTSRGTDGQTDRRWAVSALFPRAVCAPKSIQLPLSE